MGFKIYTKTGDGGETGLYGGDRVAKDDARLEAYGTVDELNAAIGVLRGALGSPSVLAEAAKDEALLSEVQSTLFTIGSQLATPAGRELSIVPVAERNVERLELAIDRLDDELPGLSSFILPAGPRGCAEAHVCRTVARRAERRVVTLRRDAPVDLVIVRYLNRLSDYFFTLARAVTHWRGGADEAWVAAKR